LIGSSTAFLFEGTLHSAKDVEAFYEEKEEKNKEGGLGVIQ